MLREYTFKVVIADPEGEEHTFYRTVQASGFTGALHACLDTITFVCTPENVVLTPVNFQKSTQPHTYEQARGCGGKDSYTQDAAEAIAEYFNSNKPRKGKIANAYRCRYCHNWHVGNTDAP